MSDDLVTLCPLCQREMINGFASPPQVEPDGRHILIGGARRALSRTEAKILKLLWTRQPEFVTKAEFLSLVWHRQLPRAFVKSRSREAINLRVQVWNLRRKTAGAPWQIESGEGYRISPT